MIPGNPNAAIGGVGGGGFGVLLVYLLNKYAGTSFDATEGAAIAGGIATIVLFIGRRGLVGVVRQFLYGTPPAAKK